MEILIRDIFNRSGDSELLNQIDLNVMIKNKNKSIDIEEHENNPYVKIITQMLTMKNYKLVKKYIRTLLERANDDEKGCAYGLFGVYYKAKLKYAKMEYNYFLAMDLECAGAMCNLGDYYYDQRNYSDMMNCYMRGIAKGDVSSMLNLAYYYLKIEVNYHKMKEFDLMAVAKGSSIGMTHMGNYYNYNEENYDEMKRYYLMAIRKGNHTAMRELSKYYKDIEEDNDNSIKYELMSMLHSDNVNYIQIAEILDKRYNGYFEDHVRENNWCLESIERLQLEADEFEQLLKIKELFNKEHIISIVRSFPQVGFNVDCVVCLNNVKVGFYDQEGEIPENAFVCLDCRLQFPDPIELYRDEFVSFCYCGACSGNNIHNKVSHTALRKALLDEQYMLKIKKNLSLQQNKIFEKQRMELIKKTLELDKRIINMRTEIIRRDILQKLSEEKSDIVITNISENIMTPKCPSCNVSWTLEDGCLAVTCKCGCKFCALCLKSDPNDIHSHVSNCLKIHINKCRLLTNITITDEFFVNNAHLKQVMEYSNVCRAKRYLEDQMKLQLESIVKKYNYGEYEPYL
jgi:hypothetical protein